MRARYRRGAEYERRARKALEAAGYTVVRAAGSKGPWDLVAVNEQDPTERVRCIQVKVVASPADAGRHIRRFQPTSPSRLDRRTTYHTELWIYIPRQIPIASGRDHRLEIRKT